VTFNKGKKTPGVDGVLWQGARAKWRAANSLHRRGYRPQPLRRIYIKKKNGKLRPLSIPTMYDRAQQALYKLGLAPVAETTADRNSYLEDVIRPVVENFLAERGLELSAEKTVITHIKDGFTFLGQTFRKHGRVLHITPSTKGVHALMQKVGTLIRKHVSAPMPVLIKKLNATLRGWANYHRHVVASEAFSRIDTYVYEQLWRMIRKRYRSKSAQWLIKHYWSAAGRNTFAIWTKTAKNGAKLYRILRTSAIGIRRHVKIKADANPYLPEYAWYFWRRRHHKESKLLPAM
jgi:RNA-directed DNA polymerase